MREIRAKNVMMPGNAIKRHLHVEDRMNRLEKDGSDFAINKAEYNDTSIGFITSGIPYQYVKEVFPQAFCVKTWYGISASEKID